jgi:hypothetical protein
MATNRPMNGSTLNVMAVTMDANAHTDATNMNADDGGIGHARTQQGQDKDRSDKSFHNGSLSRSAHTPPSPVSAWMAMSLLR